MAKVPFSDDIAFLVLENLKNTDFVQSLVDELTELFKVRLDWAEVKFDVAVELVPPLLL